MIEVSKPPTSAAQHHAQFDSSDISDVIQRLQSLERLTAAMSEEQKEMRASIDKVSEGTTQVLALLSTRMLGEQSSEQSLR